MNIGLDYDDTYTRDPECWDMVIRQFQAKGHSVVLTTWRFPDETTDLIHHLSTKLDGVYFTGRVAKEKFMFAQGVFIHVWIDDNPWTVYNTMEGY